MVICRTHILFWISAETLISYHVFRAPIPRAPVWCYFHPEEIDMRGVSVPPGHQPSARLQRAIEYSELRRQAIRDVTLGVPAAPN